MHRQRPAQHGVQQVQRARHLGLVADADLDGTRPAGRFTGAFGRQRHDQLVDLVPEGVARDGQVEAVHRDVGAHAQRHVGPAHAQREEAVVVRDGRSEHRASGVHGVYRDAPRGPQRLGARRPRGRGLAGGVEHAASDVAGGGLDLGLAARDRRGE
ncbi:MAG: hypothetical protein IPN77_18695 [Sandaracinaceae bacterium]|nr:hypothetical protein [Sandaracinaceae bacterium]